MFDSLWPQWLWHARLPWPPPPSLEFAQIYAHWVSDTTEPSHPLSPSSPFAFSLSQHQTLCQWVSSSHQIVNFSFSISPSSEYSGLISFRIDWFDHLSVQGTLKSLFWHHSSKASILRCSAFFMVQLLHPYMTTGKTVPWTTQTFVGKLISVFTFAYVILHYLMLWQT